MNRIGKKIAWMSLSGMMIFSLPSCGKKDNAADERLLTLIILFRSMKLQQQMKVIR